MNKSVPDNCTVAGNPFRIIKENRKEKYYELDNQKFMKSHDSQNNIDSTGGVLYELIVEDVRSRVESLGCALEERRAAA